MKTKFTFASLVSAALLLSCPVFGQENVYYPGIQTAEIYQTEEWIEIDGLATEEEWSKAKEYTLGNVLHNWGVDPIENTWGYGATFKATYDENYLYLFIRVTDDTYVPFDEAQMTGETNIDNIELYFYPDPETRSVDDETTVNDYRSKGLSQLRISVGNEDNRATGGGYAMGFASNNELIGYEYKTVKTDKGYDAEVVLPWDVIISKDFIGNLQQGKKILFDVNAANCTDYASGRVIILGWSTNDFQDWKDNKRFGEILFMGGAPAAISQVEQEKAEYTFDGNLLHLSNVADETEVSVFDLSGRVLSVYSFNGQAIDLSGLNAGVYIVRVDGMQSFKIVK